MNIWEKRLRLLTAFFMSWGSPLGWSIFRCFTGRLRDND